MFSYHILVEFLETQKKIVDSRIGPCPSLIIYYTIRLTNRNLQYKNIFETYISYCNNNDDRVFTIIFITHVQYGFGR